VGAEKVCVEWAVKEKAQPGRTLTARQRARNRRFGSVRTKVEHVFRVMKCQSDYRKVHYRGIAKNGAQVFALPGTRQPLPRPQNPCVRAGGAELAPNHRRSGRSPSVRSETRSPTACLTTPAA
jgi:hypothetical protein